MNSTRPIRALLRGLDALTVLNARDGASASEIAAAIGLPRTTAYRILDTLCEAGFVLKDAADERYRLTILTRDLSAGFEDDDWIGGAAQPAIDELRKIIVWPVSLSTQSGVHMVIRASTDHHTPLALERRSVGCRLSLLESAAGRAYLAHCPPGQSKALLDILGGARGVEQELEQIRRLGFATLLQPRRLLDEIELSVPARLDAQLLSIVSVRFMASAVPLQAGVQRFLPLLRQCAANLARTFLEQQTAACFSATPG